MSDNEQTKNTEKSIDARELSDILDTVGEKAPRILRDIMNALYSKEAGTNMGQAIGAFYNELLAAGIPQDAALKMAKEFSFSLKDIKFDSGKNG